MDRAAFRNRYVYKQQPFRLVDVDVGQADATIKSKPFDTFDACRDRYAGKPPAIFERKLSDRFDAVWNNDTGKFCTTGKCGRANFHYTVRDCNASCIANIDIEVLSWIK